jgi:tripartite-type tricarboxylate transporter receptor subunit TctC
MRLAGKCAWLLMAAPIALGLHPAIGQSFPSKPIRILATGAGGGGDFAARLIAQGLTASLGKQVVVENRGGSVIIPVQIVQQAPPDGHTLLLYASTFWVLPLMQEVPYDPVADFSPITLPVTSPNILVVHPSLPVKSVKELIALAKNKPGALNYASTAPGGPPHLAAELFKSMAGVKIAFVPYKSAGQAISELVGGQVQMMFLLATSLMPQVKAGKLRALAVTSARPTALVPGLPTVAASLPGFEMVTNVGIFAPARTDDAIIRKLHREIVQILHQPEVKQRFFNAGTDVVASTPEELAAAMKSEMAAMSRLIKTAGLRVD